MRSVRRLSTAFAAGALGGAVNGIVVWGAGGLGLTTALGVQIAPALTRELIYSKVVWGAIWGLLFLLPLWRRSVVVRGLIYSIGPTLVQLLLVFPLKADKGMLGLELGVLTPLFVLLFNAAWGITAALWVVAAAEPAGPMASGVDPRSAPLD
ncbi:MAG: hypothetical protein PVJ27_09345 [Candidatus Brocadiaceae bacterium]|jgi:hypothetical protein